MIERTITLGRAEENDIVLSDPTVSGKHAKIIIKQDKYFIEDLGSSNGTRVNGKLVTKKEIYEGDDIKLGTYTLKPELLSDLLAEGEPTVIVETLRPGFFQRNRKVIKYAGGVLILAILIFAAFWVNSHFKVDKKSPSEIFRNNRENVVLINHKYLGVKGNKFLCQKSDLLEEAAEEREIQILSRPDLPYAIVPDRELAEKFPFEIWGVGVIISDDGKVLTHRTLADPLYCLEPFSSELSVIFNGETISQTIWKFGMNIERKGIAAAHVGHDYSAEEELSILKLDLKPESPQYLPIKKIMKSDEIEVLSPTVIISYNSPESRKFQKTSKVIPISLSGKISGIVDNQVNFNLEENATFLPGSPVFSLSGKLIGISGDIRGEEGFSYSVNPVDFLREDQDNPSNE